MTIKELARQLDAIMGRKPIDDLAYAVVSEGFPVKDLVDLCFHKEQKIGFHAAWVLEQVCTAYFDYFVDAFPYFVERMPAIKNASVKRHFGKITVYSLKELKKDAYKRASEIFWKGGHEALIQAFFEWLIDPAIRPGVKVWCMDALDILAPHYPWIYDELRPTVQSLLVDAAPGLLVRGKRLLKKASL